VLRGSLIALFFIGCSSFGTGSSAPPPPPPPANDGGTADGSGLVDGGTASRCASIRPGAFCDDFDQGEALLPRWLDARPNVSVDSAASYSGTSSLLVTVPRGAANNPQYIAKAVAVERRLHLEGRVWHEVANNGIMDLIAVSRPTDTPALRYEVNITRTASTNPWTIEENMESAVSHKDLAGLVFGKWDLIELTIDLEAKKVTFDVNKQQHYERTIAPLVGLGELVVKLGFPYAQDIEPGRVRWDDVVIYSE